MYYFTVNYSTIYYSTTTPAVCISETDLRRFTVHLLFYYVTILLLFQYCTILLCTILLLIIPLFTILPRPQPFASRKPTCAGSRFCTILLFYYSSTVQSRLNLGNRPAPVHGSLTILLFYSFTILLLFQYCTILLCTILLLTIPLFTILPRPQPFASRKPTCTGSRLFYYFTILLFYYFTILLFYYFTILLFYYSSTVQNRLHLGNRPAPVHGSLTILLCYYFTIIPVLYYSTMYYFTVNYSTIYYSTTTPAVCISETDLRRFTVHFFFIILLFYYSSTVQSRLHLGNRPAPVQRLLLLARLLLLRLFNRILASDSCGVGNKIQNAKKQTRRNLYIGPVPP